MPVALKRILFVDDEPQVLTAIQTLLYRNRREWEMVFVGSGAAALEEFERHAFDVIVADLRMPQMDGIALLHEVQRRYPGTVRIALSGRSDVDTPLRSVPYVHRYLAKPCNPNALRQTLQEACALRAIMADDRVVGIVGAAGLLPACPQAYADLCRVLAEPHPTLEQVSAVVERDLALSASLLHVVNSSFIAPAESITDVGTAVRRVGVAMLQSIVLSHAVFRALPARPATDVLALRWLTFHSLATAHLARRLATKERAAEAFSAGLLHDVGLLVLATARPERFAEGVGLAQKARVTLFDAEQEVLGVSHAAVGAYLLGLWGLPLPVVEAVAGHQAPAESDGDVVHAVHVADHLAWRVHFSFAPGVTVGPLREGSLLRLGLLGKVDELVEMARTEVQRLAVEEPDVLHGPVRPRSATVAS